MVDSIAPASGSQFSLLPPDNATGNFTKVVQRIPVKIVLDPGHPLAGQAAAGHVGGRDDPDRHGSAVPVTMTRSLAATGRVAASRRSAIVRCSASPPCWSAPSSRPSTRGSPPSGWPTSAAALSSASTKARGSPPSSPPPQMVVCAGGGLAQHRARPAPLSCCGRAAIFCVASVLPPLTRDPMLLLALQFVRGLAVGAFIPAALGFILRSLPPRWWIWGIAAYAFRFVFSQNISVIARGVLRRARAVAVDLLAERAADADHDGADLVRHAARADRPRAAARGRLDRHRLRGTRPRPASMPRSTRATGSTGSIPARSSACWWPAGCCSRPSSSTSWWPSIR